MSRSLWIPVKLLHEAAGHVVTVELETGEVYRGSMIDCEDNWNCQIENIPSRSSAASSWSGDGRVRASPTGRRPQRPCPCASSTGRRPQRPRPLLRLADKPQDFDPVVNVRQASALAISQVKMDGRAYDGGLDRWWYVASQSLGRDAGGSRAHGEKSVRSWRYVQQQEGDLEVGMSPARRT